jgi:hypothetical protein
LTALDGLTGTGAEVDDRVLVVDLDDTPVRA